MIMWYEVFKFELKYRLKRPDTYLFFLFLLLFALFGVEFVFQGIDLGLVKKNAPLVIAKSMGAITGLSMLIASMIMGVPVLRDFQYDTASLIYVNPISKKDYLLGRYLGSLAVLIFIFSGLLFGMILGEYMPWVDPNEYMPFRFVNYLQPFCWVTLPTFFFGASIFFVSGALSKKLMVVYTQGIAIFVIFMLTKAITNETLQAILDPFSLTTLTKASEHWTVEERNTLLIPDTGVMLYNKLSWILLGLASLAFGYSKFQLNVVSAKASKNKPKQTDKAAPSLVNLNANLLATTPVYHFQAQFNQLFLNAWFHTYFILKQSSFWAIVLCSFIIIIINSVNLGTIYGVDSYPTTFLIIEELQEMSIYFFIIILVFYSGEIMWKEKEAKLNLIYDATPLNSFVKLMSKFLGLLIIYAILMFALIGAGILFQTINGYFHYKLGVYFSGFFLEIFPFLALYTFAALFFQALTGHKFIGIIATLVFAMINVLIGVFGVEQVLLNFGGHSLARYSEMNDYGHFLKPYLFVKTYWAIVGILLLIIAAILIERGTETHLKRRWKAGREQLGKPLTTFSIFLLLLLIGIGGYIFYNTNVLNEFWTQSKKERFRADYEKTLKQFEYIEQPKIIATNLKVELYPSERAYEIDGEYILANSSNKPIRDIHIQKVIEADVKLTDIRFNQANTVNKIHSKFDYHIYTLQYPLMPGDSLKMYFSQRLTPKGFEANPSFSGVLYNGTFFNNNILPSFGYRKKYELQDEAIRKSYNLPPRITKAKRDNDKELANARTGSDSDGTTLEMIIGTEAPQTAVTSGNLVRQWSEKSRNYFHYKTDQPIINFYSIVSADYTIVKDAYISSEPPLDNAIDLEIYYHKGHEYNLSRMMESMKMSLDYCSKNFSPYRYKQIRIMEFPRYWEFAQSFPNAVPFSEAIGFILDIDDEQDVDMAFYITAHELAHQWWGLQLEAANVQGQNMILETLAQYTAIMILKEKYPEEKIKQFLLLQLEDYQKGKRRAKKEELPLILVENEEHLYYAKGAINMYAFQKYIGEEQVNLALRNFLSEWHTFNKPNKPNRYTTTEDLMNHFRAVTPDSLQYIITDLFETVKYYDVQTEEIIE